MRRSFSALLAVLVVTVPAATFAADMERDRRLQQSRAMTLAVAAVEGDALTDLFLAGQVGGTPGDDTGERQRLLERGLRNGWDDPTALAFLLSYSNLARDADAAEWTRREARLREIAGDNAYAHLVLVSRAWARRDDAAVATALHEATAARRFESVERAMGRALERRYSALPALSFPTAPGVDRDTARRAAAVASTTGLVFYSPIPRVAAICDTPRDAIAAGCLALFRAVLDGSDRLRDVTLAARVLETSEDAAQRAHAQAEYRRIAWIGESVLPAIREMRSADGAPPATAARMLVTLVSEGELPAFRQMARDRGVATEPPADWTPPPSVAAGPAPTAR